MSYTELEAVRLYDDYQNANKIFVAALTRAMRGERTIMPDRLIWRTETHTNHHSPRFAGTYFTDRDALAEGLRTYRDPCTYCGTRKDIGCRHHPRAAA